ncbi:ankyrin repeat domain-containing protein [Pseudomaricurvus alkylphenolicus]|jgi:hypothetical protein|uniref:ankyrin repeat domain-containing protein n=1 Tax=Pseudomaricurvus alkylphenolicus TaxID=1306991 RepID=UPI0014238241|nr:ankyrin repeat domain-containing protein [Pseudomaricurvus alkylphenolicus]NIB45045.1 ankyrin repeat domain-containing protein [Pseudomaricurvus alkylphenolicus]
MIDTQLVHQSIASHSCNAFEKALMSLSPQTLADNAGFLHQVVSRGNLPMVKVSLRYHKSSRLMLSSALITAITHGFNEIADCLHQKGASLMGVTHNHLYECAKRGHARTVHWLFQVQAPITLEQSDYRDQWPIKKIFTHLSRDPIKTKPEAIIALHQHALDDVINTVANKVSAQIVMKWLNIEPIYLLHRVRFKKAREGCLEMMR